MDGQTEHEIIAQHVTFQPVCEGWLGLPELPSSGELNPSSSAEDLSKAVVTSLGRNDVTTVYASKDEYLETHYRLNREEGIALLRSGVREYKESPWMMDNSSTLVYTKVAVTGYLMSALGPICRVQFSTERAGAKIRWSTSKRLTPGTLLAVTTAKDNFTSICMTAVVMARNAEDVNKNSPTVDIQWADSKQMVFDPTEELVMIESRNGFFEAVRHTLVGLQHVAACQSPLLQYLVGGSKQDGTPRFVQENSKMDLTPIIHHLPGPGDELRQLLETFSNYDITAGIPEEIAKRSSLDSSQLQAVHRLLTKELAICQGPPGTGKTYTSVQALLCMIHNETAGLRKSPGNVIVVAAETNHAVDQILTHLIKADVSVVRLGSRTRDEEVKSHSLFNLRRRSKSKHNRDYGNVNKARLDTAQEIERAVADIFSPELVDPAVFLKYGIITQEQFDSVSESWGWIPSPGRPSGPMAEWLDNAARDVQIHIKQSVFDVEETADDEDHDGIDKSEWELDVDDPTNDSNADSFRLQGRFVAIKRKWGGASISTQASNTPMLSRHMARSDFWDIDERWRGTIYEEWHKSLLKLRSVALVQLFAKYTRLCKNLKISGWKRDVECIQTKGIHVIGCTTTGLSKYRGLLAALKPKILLVEEAGQSREAHIAAALLPSLQQLVLVGDHQQLVPHCDVPGLADGYHNLTVSMFERLVEYMHLPYTILNQQRRMIPEIRAVLNPFYPGLGDHPAVKDKTLRPEVPGMAVNSYLFNHHWVENTDVQSFSKYNTEEANMIVCFAAYLVQNQVQPQDITVLTFYRGQVKEIRKLLRSQFAPMFGEGACRSICVATVDSYQGEENDIVLLSLVRSSVHKNRAVAGFVGDMNRGVVSISRAKRGFYVFGNMENLASATETSSFMWGSVRQVFEKQERYSSTSPRLPLRCQKHGKVTYAVDAEDLQTRHGGCLEKCSEKFQPCGHLCGRLCHPMSHDSLICQHACQRKVPCGHACQMFCGDDCVCQYNCFAFRSSLKMMRNSSRQDGFAQSVGTSKAPASNKWAAWTPENERCVPNTTAISDKPIPQANHDIRDSYRPVRIGADGQRLTGRTIVYDEQRKHPQAQIVDIGRSQNDSTARVAASDMSQPNAIDTTDNSKRKTQYSQTSSSIGKASNGALSHDLSDAFFEYPVGDRVLGKRGRMGRDWEESSEDESSSDEFGQLEMGAAAAQFDDSDGGVGSGDGDDGGGDDGASDLITF
ncbi:hypothetical protein LQW54_000538 [Pestalotiopsis sp. IQ-011]